MAGTSHRFAAVLAADVARFSARMESDAEATVQTLQNCRLLFRRCVEDHRGREFGSVGDSLMAEFQSPVEALRAARDFQAQLNASTPGTAERDPLLFRIGLHAGDVLINEDDLFGDVVNTAARLQELARPGGIAMSGFFNYQVRNEPGVDFRAMGTHSLKNIAEPVAVYEVARQRRRFNWRRLKLALLPYRIALAATLGVVLASLTLIAYQEYREQPGMGGIIDIPSNPEAVRFWIIGNDHLKETDPDSYRKALTAFNEALDRQPDFAAAYAGIANAHLFSASWHGSETVESVLPLASAAAYKALELDPNLSDAYFALARVHQYEWNWEGAERAFRRGAVLGSTDTPGIVEFANFLTAMGRGQEAIEVATRAVELDPHSPVNLNELGFALAFNGQMEAALEQYQKALQLDPDFGQTHGCLADLYLRTGRPEKAVPHLEQIHKTISTRAPNWYGQTGMFYGLAGQPEKTRQVLELVRQEFSADEVSAVTFAYLHLGLGEHDESLKWLAAAQDERDISLIWLKEHWIYDELRDDVRFQDLVARMRFPD